MPIYDSAHQLAAAMLWNEHLLLLSHHISHQPALTEVIFCLHAIFVVADYFAPSVLPILLMLLAIDIFLCTLVHHSILMCVIVPSLLHTLPLSSIEYFVFFHCNFV